MTKGILKLSGFRAHSIASFLVESAQVATSQQTERNQKDANRTSNHKSLRAIPTTPTVDTSQNGICQPAVTEDKLRVKGGCACAQVKGYSCASPGRCESTKRLHRFAPYVANRAMLL